MEKEKVKNVKDWKVGEVIKWLASKGFNSNIQQIFESHEIDGYVLTRLTEEDLRMSAYVCMHVEDIFEGNNKNKSLKSREPMGISKLGILKHLIGDIEALVPAKSSSPIRNGSQRLYSRSDSSTSTYHSDTDHHYNQRKYSNRLKPEKFKTLVAAIYGGVVMYICALILTIVNDRVPDMDKYPPLPDLFLDNVPYIPWAFKVSEYIVVTLFLIFFAITVTHKHRYIILRRFLSLGGTLFLLRGICMLITSLSVPCRYFECRRYGDDGVYAKMKRAVDILVAGGMEVDGVRYCGDYMFSGHTAILTLLSLFIDEYSDKDNPILKTLSWVLNLFGVFFVLAGHEHYSIDVFIAFYLTTRLFLYYHTLADNKAQLRCDERKVRIWFPLFWYFESENNGAVPYVYEWPIEIPKFFATKDTQDCKTD